LILPIKWFSKKKIPARRSLSLIKEGSSKKRKRKEKEQGSKVKVVKPHLPIQGLEKIYEKERKRVRNSRQVGDTILKESENADHIFLQCKIWCGIIHTHISFSFALSSNPWIFLLSPIH
jgi:hypothetical protein